MGDIEVLPDLSLCVRCPWHSWCIELTSGRVLEPKGKTMIYTQVYKTEVNEEGTIFVAFDQLAEKYFTGNDVEF